MDSDLLSTQVDLPLEIKKSTNQQLKQFIKESFARPAISYNTFTFPIKTVDPLWFLQKSWNDQHFHYYWEKPVENFALAAGEALITLSASGNGRFQQIKEQQQQIVDTTDSFSVTPHSYAGLMFMGGFSFFDEIGNSAWSSFDAASLTVPEWLIFKDDKYTFATVFLDTTLFKDPHKLYCNLINKLENIDARINQPTLDESSCSTDPKTEHHSFNGDYKKWASSVDSAKEYIQQGTFEKVVLARRFSTAYSSEDPPTVMLANLRQQYPHCSCFIIHPPNGNSFLGATPEQLASFQQELLMTEALAGSMPRGDNTNEDQMLEDKLSFSAKNRQEHQFVVNDIEERLEPFTNVIYRNSEPKVKKLSNVQHLYTPIRATLKSDTDILSVTEQLHPTPAVGGYPWQKAAPYIKKLENFERGWYAGPVGWLNANGSGEFAVAIRSGLLTKDKAYFFAGCGIVADSESQTEWEETNLKLKPMLSALHYD